MDHPAPEVWPVGRDLEERMGRRDHLATRAGLVCLDYRGRGVQLDGPVVMGDQARTDPEAHQGTMVCLESRAHKEYRD